MFYKFSWSKGYFTCCDVVKAEFAVVREKSTFCKSCFSVEKLKFDFKIALTPLNNLFVVDLTPAKVLDQITNE